MKLAPVFFSANKYDVGPHWTPVCGRCRPLYENMDSPGLLLYKSIPFYPSPFSWSSSHDFSLYNFLWKAHCECWSVPVEVLFWSIRKLSKWSVLSVQIDLHALQGVGWGGGLLTHISIMLASISHIWPKFWPIAIKFIKVLTHILPKLHTAAFLATKIFLWLSFKKSFCSIRE